MQSARDSQFRAERAVAGLGKYPWPCSGPDVANHPLDRTRYRVVQTFLSFGMDCEETLDTPAEANAYGRAIAEDLAQAFFQSSEGCVDVPLRSPFNLIGYSNENAFFSSLLKSLGVSAGAGHCQNHLRVQASLKWSDLVDRIFEAAIVIEPIGDSLTPTGRSGLTEDPTKRGSHKAGSHGLFSTVRELPRQG
jgi:hypothetical protein